MTALTGQVTTTNIRIPYLFYRGHIEVKELNPVGQCSHPTHNIFNHSPAHGISTVH